MTSAGIPAGMAPPGVKRPTIFGRAYPSAVDAAPCARPRRPAIPLSAVAPSARSTSPAAIGLASGRPSQDAASEVRPADLNLSRKPSKPPGELEIIARTSLTSDRALAPRPNRAAKSSISASNAAMSSSPKDPLASLALQKTMTAPWRLKRRSRRRLKFCGGPAHRSRAASTPGQTPDGSVLKASTGVDVSSNFASCFSDLPLSLESILTASVHQGPYVSVARKMISLLAAIFPLQEKAAVAPCRGNKPRRPL